MDKIAEQAEQIRQFILDADEINAQEELSGTRGGFAEGHKREEGMGVFYPL